MHIEINLPFKVTTPRFKWKQPRVELVAGPRRRARRQAQGETRKGHTAQRDTPLESHWRPRSDEYGHVDLHDIAASMLTISGGS